MDTDDICNVKAFFKILDKSDRMWEKMIDFEFRYGSFFEYRRLVAEVSRGNTGKNKIEHSVINKAFTSGLAGYRLQYELLWGSLEFMGLELERDTLLKDFIDQLPTLGGDNLFCYLKTSRLIGLLSTVEFF